MESVVAAIKEHPQGAELLVAGDFNVKILEPELDQRGGGGIGGASYRVIRGYVGSLPPTMVLILPGREYM